jgi:pentafunctional AROM polypeptide
MTSRLLTGLFRPKKFAILGCNIAYSVSPEMHGAAFAATKLPHEYYRIDVETVDEFVNSEFFLSDDFGGASVTIPHKQAIIPFIDFLSDAAKEIGSVNTISVTEEFTGEGFKRVIQGDNTDWRGIYNPINRRLTSCPNVESDCALILGAGGTARAAAYAAKKLGMAIFYYNRTPENAKPLVDSFGGTLLESFDASVESERHFLEITKRLSLRVVISTLPAASKIVLPGWVLRLNGSKPIIFDVNYKPYYTSLLRQAEQASCPIVRGSEMLWEQGVGQFEIWTERSAPYSVMKEAVLQNCDIS